MIADGAGFNIYDSTADYMTGNSRGMIYHGADWTLYGCSTYSLSGTYGAEFMWANFENQKQYPTDSAAASTALHTGQKTLDGRITRDAEENDLMTIAERIHQHGFAAGSVTSVSVADATPGAVAAHVSQRAEGQKIFRQMIENGNLDVIIGGGHPDFDKNGKRYQDTDGFEKPQKFSQCGPDEAMWEKIKTGQLPEGMRFIEKRKDFQKIAKNENVPSKLLGIAQIAETFQAQRERGWERLKCSPTLSEASLAALNVLNRNEKGFYLMIEGGAVDWANHANDLSRAVEEMVEFNEAVEAVCAWVEENSSWEETLLIVTADHETGAFWGPNADQADSLFQLPTMRGKGNLADGKYFSIKHTNMLVPFYVRGNSAEDFAGRVRGTDEKAGRIFRFSGKFIDNTDVFLVARKAFGL